MKITRRSLLGAAAAAPGVRGGILAGDSIVVLRQPDRVTAFTGEEALVLERGGEKWTAKDVTVGTAEAPGPVLRVTLAAPRTPLQRIHLRWLAKVPSSWRFLGDHWERSYADAEWRGMVGDRVMPWYFLAFDGAATHGFGVKTGPAALCFWQVDPDGISLWLDVRNGGWAVRLGERRLDLATVTVWRGEPGVTPFASARRFCRKMCDRPRLPAAPVYGSNTWYYTYGKGFGASDVLKYSELLADWAPRGGNRPFLVIDAGWQPSDDMIGPWDRGKSSFPDMAESASRMRERSVRPGIWIRPLYTNESVPEAWRLAPHSTYYSRERLKIVLDPTVPDVQARVRADISRLVRWGYELVKHDFTSIDLFGRSGSLMGAELTGPGWHFADRSKTTAEVILDLYRLIRDAAADAVIIGCNTVGHLGAGLFELQRIGDDTSGLDFARTRRYGVNAIGFRMPQHETFFAADADCAPHTSNLPWEMSRQWLDLLARSGTPLFVSFDPRATGPAQVKALRAALAAAALPQPAAEPLDWMETTTPARWRIHGAIVRYDWFGEEGGSPAAR